MNSRIKGSFWTDDEIGELDTNLKLTALWVISNPEVNCLGITKISARQFTFNTGLPVSEIERLCQAMPRAFKSSEGLVVALNFIEHQLGSGEKLRSNNIFRSCVHAYASVRQQWLSDLLAASCPELRQALSTPSKPFQGQSKGEGEGESYGEGKGESEGETGKKNTARDEDGEFLNFAAAWPGEKTSDTPVMPAEWAKEFLKKMRLRVLMPRDMQQAAVAAWRAEHRTWKPGAAAAQQGWRSEARADGEPPQPLNIGVRAVFEKV